MKKQKQKQKTKPRSTTCGSQIMNIKFHIKISSTFILVYKIFLFRSFETFHTDPEDNTKW